LLRRRGTPVWGQERLQNNTTGTFNTAIGVGALVNNTTGSDNTAIGDTALSSNKI
jgi:trimeric autotransporter adhesin